MSKGTQCPKGGEHTWKITDYVDDNTVMRGPVCTKCSAIGEYVLGTREAGLMTVDDLQSQIDSAQANLDEASSGR